MAGVEVMYACCRVVPGLHGVSIELSRVIEIRVYITSWYINTVNLVPVANAVRLAMSMQ